MILVIDIGNTNIMLGGFIDDTLSFVSRLSTEQRKTEDEFAAQFRESLALYGIDRSTVSGVMIASVVPPLNLAVEKAVRFLFGIDPLFVGPGIKSGISIRCDMPSSVGADLIAASVAARYLYKIPALIIDMGTATKFSLVNEKGEFVGTSIAPGVMMGLNALSDGTAQLPKISLEIPVKVIEKNTADCMRSGVLFGNAALIDGMIDRISAEFGTKLNVYATGGMADLVIPLCTHKIDVDEYLVLKGLNILYQKNSPIV